ncbi:two-component system sensor histidine kinase YesM [Evansella vedderi]|uniref:histidine kinase n=1 Tax=Evansella vedderi TaxID=38282 RepID=A0ABT9ZXE6_9BACI|nr:sensor histidine kinase [Evansella vedderi]MDQ0255906.1 two-component system sensor histidine kinase YesM [Evansella vedderi]
MTTNNIKNQKMHDIELVLDQITNEFIHVVDQAVAMSTGIYTDSRLYDFFEEEYESTLQYVEAYDYNFREFHRYSPLYYSIQSIYFYTDNPGVLYAGGIRPLNNVVKEEEWYKKLNGSTNPIVIRTNPFINSDLFSVIRKLDFFKDKNRYEKIVRIDINPLSIRQLFHNMSFQGEVYLLNGEGYIEYTTDNSLYWMKDYINFESVNIDDDLIILDEKRLNNNYFEGWKVVGTISEKEILKELYNSRRFIIMLVCINFILPTLIIIFISRSIHTRILRVLKHMKRMKKQKFDTIQFAGDKDEIGELTDEFNKMSHTINKLINEVYVANIQKKDLELKEKQAQLSALQSQINPHFLFNALETIRMRSVIKGEKETAKIIQNMAKIFRNSLTWGKDWVTVREELKLITCFLEIQKYRFGDKLEYTLDIDEEAYDCIIPNMVFLPFVENASIHGIESLKEKGKLHIAIHVKRGEVVFTIEDNGAGMSEEKLTNLIESLKNEESMGESVGIKNVYYRLKLYYKNDYDFTINSYPGKGTTVQIKLPVAKQGKC